MLGQLSIFDLLEESTEVFCWDNDVNEIHDMLVEMASKHGLDVTKEEWEIWSHVPHFGYRMTFTISLRKGEITDALLQELNDIVEFAKARKVEISPVAPYYLSDYEKRSMYIFSTFMDKERQKIRSLE